MAHFHDNSDARLNPKREDIAIVGIGCRFPGASGPAAFWQLMCDGLDAVTEIPSDRFDVNAVYDPRPGIPGKIVTRRAGFLENIDAFDPEFFGISPREAVSMDPQQRLLLEVAWEALEDAGQVPADLANSPTGVFIGMCASDYGDLQLHFGDPANLDVYSVPGSARSILSGRLSYIFNLQGPSVALDTACSSSLVAVHLACQSLWSGECTLALAGGVNLMLMPEPFTGFSMARMLAPDGRCKAFDARGDGFVRSEGAGVVVLKPLSCAQADGDPIYAVIRGSAANNDGRSSGLMMPSQRAQEDVLRAAYRDAGVAPGQIHYVEAHGTGTNVGDPIEARAIGTVLAEGRPQDRPCIIGSVKTNIGHLEGGAGIAGLIKVALCLKHRMIPPNLHFDEPNPYIPWEELPLRVQTELTPWPVDTEPALAGVSSFGISGTNVHVVIGEAPQAAPMPAPESVSTPYLLPLSAHTAEALQAMAHAYQAFITTEGAETVPSLVDLGYTASVRRSHHTHRLAIVAHSRAELVEHLEVFLQEEQRPGMSSGVASPGQKHTLVFVFSGQGPQWWPLDRALLEQEPVFRETLERCDALFRRHVDWSLLDELMAEEAQARFNQTDIGQPAIFALQVALAALWRSWGIEPDAVVGHSIGEVAAAYVADVLSLEDAVRVIHHRSRVTTQVIGKGKMALVGLPLEQARAELAGYEDRLSIGVNSSPMSTVLSGDPDALKEVLASLEQQNVFCRMLPAMDYAAHSPQMEPLKRELMEALEGLQPRTALVPIYSTVTGTRNDGLTFDASYWADNLREPVLFSTTVERLLTDGYDTFLEVHPHPVLPRSIQEVLVHVNREGTVLSSLKRGEVGRTMLLGALGALYTLGYSVAWRALYPSGGRCVPLPAYPWQRERYWLEVPGRSNGGVRRSFGYDGRHPLLGEHLTSAAHAGTHFWEMELDTDSVPYLRDHRVQGLIVLPAAAYVEIVMAAARDAFGDGVHTLEHVSFKKALFLPEDGSYEIQLVLAPAMPGTVSFQLFSRPTSAAEEAWTLHATGKIRRGRAEEMAPMEQAPLEEIQSRCTELIDGAEHYQIMTERGLQYGPSFQGVARIWRQDGEAIGRLHFSDAVTSSADAYQVHPALLDACFQVLEAAVPRVATDIAGDDTYLPVGLEHICLYDRPINGTWGYACVQTSTDLTGDTLAGDVFLLDELGHVVLEARGLRLQRLGIGVQSVVPEQLDEWLYEIQWFSKARTEDQPAPTSAGSWLIFADRRGTGKALAERLNSHGERCVLVFPHETYGRTYKRTDREYFRINPGRPKDMQKLLEAGFGADHPPCRGVIHLWALDEDTSEAPTVELLEAAQTRGCISVLHVVQALTRVGRPPRLWLVTRGTQTLGIESEPVAITHAPLWGLGKVIANEHPELRCTTVDLNAGKPSKAAQALLAEVWSGDQEDQIALRGDERYVARLVRYEPDAVEETLRVADESEAFRLEVTTPGILDNLTLRATTRQAPEPGQVEIRVHASGLNFLDVLSALGMRPDQGDGPILLGMECAGTIAAVGEGVEGLHVGDEVIAIAPYSFSAYTRTLAPFVVPKPAQLSFEEAATIPVAFLTAYYAMEYLGRIRAGERILIHAAAGGVGLAAVRLAQRAGAEIYATAGNPEKRAFLHSLGVEHVMDSRSLAFADEVMDRTTGEGIDLVLNSLAGDAIPRSLSLLRANGRFLEIGKRDIYQNSLLEMGHFKKNIAFFAIDLIPMFTEQPEFCGTMLRELMQYFEDGSLTTLDHTVFPISEVESAFRYMAQAKHIGKIVVSMQEQEVLIASASGESAPFRAHGTYLLTGGLGGLGLTVADWMVRRGARHLVLMGRSSPSPEARAAVDAMEAAGAQIMIALADVTQEEQVAGVLADIKESMPPLRGIIHAAGVLDDGILLQQNQERFARVMAPKVNGAWILHKLTVNEALDHFVLFSSVASVLGSPGQGNYVAANAFLDALAHHRRANGLPASAINWGAWADVGLAARADRVAHLTQQGIVPFTPRQGVQLLERLLHDDPVQMTVLAVDWARLLSVFSPPLLSQLAEEVTRHAGPSQAQGSNGSVIREALLAAAPEERQQLVESFLREQIAKVLRSSAEKLDMHQPLDQLGIDSLMAYELKNRVEADLELTVPVAALLQGPSLAQFAGVLLDQLGAPAAVPATGITNGQQETEEQVAAHVDQLSDEEVDALLRELVEEDENHLLDETDLAAPNVWP